MTATVSRTNIESQPYANLYSYLDNRTIIKDPKAPRGVNQRKFLYDSDPFMKAGNFKGLPYMFLELPRIDYSHTSTNGKVKNIGWIHTLTIRSARDGSGNNKPGQGKDDILAIGDDINTFSNNETHKAALRLLNMYFFSITKVDSDTVTVDQKEVYEAIYEVRYETRMVVSS